MEFTIEIPSEISELSTIAEFIEQTGDKLELSFKAVFDINLALDELITNIINYGYATEKKGNIIVNVKKDENHVTVVIRDKGKEFNPFEMENPDISLGVEERKIGGLGIYFVKTKMDSVKYERINDENIITLLKKINGEN